VPVSFPIAPRYRHLPRDRAGSVSIEFAFLAPSLFILVFGLILFSMQYSTRIALTYAASEGGRMALAGLDDDERRNLARTAVTRVLAAWHPLVDTDRAEISVLITQDGNGKLVTVKIDYTDSRFVKLPFLPTLSSNAPVSVSYLITDPLG